MQIKYTLKLENLLRNSQSINRVIFSHFLITRRINCKLHLFFTVVLKENPGYLPSSALRASSHRHPLPASHFSMVFCWCQSRADDRFPCANAITCTSNVSYVAPTLPGLQFPSPPWKWVCISHPTGGERVICSQVFPHAFSHRASIAVPSCEPSPGLLQPLASAFAAYDI